MGKPFYNWNVKGKKAKIRFRNLERYYANPKVCEWCSRALDYTSRKNRFCSLSCSSTHHAAKRRESATMNQLLLNVMPGPHFREGPGVSQENERGAPQKEKT